MDTKELLTVEFRYRDDPESNFRSEHQSKTVTIGVYDTFEDAASAGNKVLEHLESKFDLNIFHSGVKANKERFSKNGGPFGSKKNLITNLAYLKTPFEFYAKITTLNYLDIDETITEVLEAGKRYKKYREIEQD